MSIVNSITTKSPPIKSVQKRIRHSSHHSVQIAISICVSLMFAVGCTSTKNSKSKFEPFLGSVPQQTPNTKVYGEKANDTKTNDTVSTYDSLLKQQTGNQQAGNQQAGSDVQNVSYEGSELSSRNVAWNQSDSVNRGSRIASEFPVNVQDANLEQTFDETKSSRIPIGGNDLSDSFLSKPNAGAKPSPLTGVKPQRHSSEDEGLNVSVIQEPNEVENGAPKAQDPVSQITIQTGGPMDLPNGNYLPVTLDEAIRLALEKSEVIRELGGSILTGPDAIQSIYNPAIIHSDPIFGEEAALSQFDARFSSSLFFEKNDREVNNQFLGTNGTVLQDLGSFRNSIDKQTAYGTTLSLRSISDYDFNNAIGNRFGNPSSSWSQILEGEARQPLLRGLGSGINRIAGPGASVGEFNGIRIAMLRTDVSATQFKIAVRDLVSNVENAYWDLYYAYRDLEAKKAARDNALKSWQVIKTLSNAKKEGGEADKEGQAREQYFRFESDVQDAMYGRKTDATRTRNGSTGGTFRPTPGVRIAERRLRRIMGIEINGDELLLTDDEPLIVSYSFDWDNLVADAETNRGELKIRGKRIEELNLQLLAAKNSALPQFDVVGRYRFRGFGKDLAGSSPTFPIGAWNDLVDGDHQEWQAGFEFNMPFGFRQAYSAIQNINQKLTREKQILHEQRRQIVNDLSDAVQDLKRSFNVYELQYNRLQGALDQLKAVEKTNALKKAPINLVLEAQRRVLDAQTQLFQSKIEYVIALRNVHLEKGTLLENKQIIFSGSTDPNGMMISPVSETISQSNAGIEFPIPPQNLDAPQPANNQGQGAAPSNGPSNNGPTAMMPPPRFRDEKSPKSNPIKNRMPIGAAENITSSKPSTGLPGFGMINPLPAIEPSRTAQMIGGKTFQ